MRPLQTKPNVTAPDSTYPYGKIKDRAGATPGTPVTEEVYGDMHQFFEKLIDFAGVTPNDLPENNTNGFQLFQALQAILMPVGSVIEYAGSSVPSSKYLFCDGGSYLRSAYPELFSVIGTTFGAADGTHFNVPNKKGRVAVGYDAGDSDYNALNNQGGSKTHTLTSAESGLPAHSVPYSGSATPGGTGFPLTNQNDPQTLSVGGADAAQAHENRQPYIVMKFLIKVK